MDNCNSPFFNRRIQPKFKLPHLYCRTTYENVAVKNQANRVIKPMAVSASNESENQLMEEKIKNFNWKPKAILQHKQENGQFYFKVQWNDSHHWPNELKVLKRLGEKDQMYAFSDYTRLGNHQYRVTWPDTWVSEEGLQNNCALKKYAKEKGLMNQLKFD